MFLFLQDDYMEGCTDGTLLSTGQKFFSCLHGQGIYYPRVNLQPDARFVDNLGNRKQPSVQWIICVLQLHITYVCE